MRRLAEPLINVVDETLSTKQPIWIIRLDLSKEFGRVDWNASWQALLRHGVSEHLVSIIHTFSGKQLGQIFGASSFTDMCPNTDGVRQGRVLSPQNVQYRVVVGMLDWKHAMRDTGCNSNDCFSTLLALPVADDILFLLSGSCANAVVFTGDSFGQRWVAVEPIQDCSLHN